MKLATCATAGSTLFGVTFASCSTQNDTSSSWLVQIPYSSNAIDTTFSVNIQGSSDGLQYDININNNSGQVISHGRTIHLVVKDQIPFGRDLVLYSLLGMTDAYESDPAIVTSWAYCHGDNLTSLWFESTLGDAGFTSSAVTGTCSVSNQTASALLQSRAECVEVVAPSAVPTIDGADLTLRNGSVGRMVTNDEQYRLLPYALVDCADCGSTADAGWYEVHSVLQSEQGDDVCVGILYLNTACSSNIAFEYVQCLQGNATSTSFSASYDLGPVEHSLGGGTNGLATTCNITGASGSSSSGFSAGSAPESTPESLAPLKVSFHFVGSLALSFVLGLSMTI